MLKKINEFNREELIAHMRASGEIHRADRESKAWKHAFKLFEETQGVKVDIDCSSCWSKVKSWIGK